MLSIPEDRPLASQTLHILATLRDVTQAHGLSCVVVGATARDILLTHVFGMPVSRATHDVDFAIAVETWAQFDALKHALAEKTGFRICDRVAHRLYFHWPGDAYGMPVDLMPFGGVEADDHTYGWPPDMVTIMNVIGYRDVEAAAPLVHVSDDISVKVASLPGLAILKIFAWCDRGATNPKDSHDLLTIIERYADAGNNTRLYQDHFPWLEACNYDPALTGVRLLGHDLALIADKKTRLEIVRVLSSVPDRDRLLGQMAAATRFVDSPQEKISAYLDQFIIGLG